MRRAFLLLLPISCSSCSPAPLLQLTSMGPGATWTQCRLEVAETADSLEWRVAFEGTERDDLVFSVSARNGSTRPRLVDPSKFSCAVAHPSGMLPRGLARPIPAHDPERVLRDMSSDESRVLANQRTAESLDGIGALLELADDLANGPKRSDEEQLRIDRERMDNDEQRVRDEHERDRRLQDLARLRDVWKGTALRRTQLSPGDSTGGRVCFPARAFAGIPARRSPRTTAITTLRATPMWTDEWVLLLRLADGPTESVFRYSISRD